MTEGSFRQAGNSLLSVLVGLAIGFLTLFVLFQSINGAMLRLQVIVEAADLRELRLHLATATDCVKAKAAISTCPAGGYIQLTDANGTVLVKQYVSDAQATVFSRFRVRAECASPTHLVIKAVAKKGGSYDWTNNADLYSRKPVPLNPPGAPPALTPPVTPKPKYFSCSF